MRALDFHTHESVCEACDQPIESEIAIGREDSCSGENTIYLCASCGPIETELMQFCREWAIGCNEN